MMSCNNYYVVYTYSCMYPLYIQSPMQSSNARQVIIEIGKYVTFIILYKPNGSHSYTTHTSIHLHSKYAGPNGLAKKTYTF